MDLFRFIGHRWDHSIYYCLPNENNLKVPFAVKVTIALLPRIDAYRQRIGEKFGNEYISFDNNITLLSVFLKNKQCQCFMTENFVHTQLAGGIVKRFAVLLSYKSDLILAACCCCC